MTYSCGDIRVWSGRTLLNFCWVSIVFDILIASISWTVAHSPINYTIFWKSIMRNFRCIYVKCFTRLCFFSEVSAKLKKMHLFRQFKSHNSGTFWELCNIYFVFSHFHVPPPLWYILVCKIAKFWAKATDSDSPLYLSRK